MSRKLTVGIVFDDSLDRPDGVQQYVFRMSEWLRAHGHEVHLIVGETKRTDLPNLHSISRNLKVRFNGNVVAMPLPVSARKIKELLALLNLDILHVQAPYSPFMAGQVIRHSKIPTVGTFHILPYSQFVSFGNRILSVLNHAADKHIATMMTVSPPAQVFAQSVYGYEGPIIPNPIRVKDFTMAAGAANARPRIVFLGRLVERKGAKALLEAVEYIDAHGLCSKGFDVVIAGKGDLLGELQAMSAHISDKISVSFAGFIAEEDKAKLIESADVFVLPSISGESFGISVLEGLAACRGVVLAGNNPGYSSVLHGLPGLLVDPQNTKDFAEKITYWVQNPKERTTMSKRQKSYVKQFDVDVVGPQVLAVYNEVLHKNNKP